MAIEKILRPGEAERCGASWLLAQLRPRTARVTNSQGAKRIYFSDHIGIDVLATIQGALQCDGGQIRNVTTTFRVKVMAPNLIF